MPHERLPRRSSHHAPARAIKLPQNSHCNSSPVPSGFNKNRWLPHHQIRQPPAKIRRSQVPGYMYITAGVLRLTLAGLAQCRMCGDSASTKHSFYRLRVTSSNAKRVPRGYSGATPYPRFTTRKGCWSVPSKSSAAIPSKSAPVMGPASKPRARTAVMK